MKKIFTILMIYTLMLACAFSSASYNYADPLPAEQAPPINNEQSLKSGVITSLPWDNDENFKQALEKASSPQMMAAYRTVLKDPLPGEEENVHLAARLLCGIVVKPGETFSQNSSIGPYIESRGFQKGPTYAGTTLITTIGGGVCKIASTLYNVAVLSNLTIVERHNHTMPVPYVPYGQDATVSYGVKDFRFKNNTDAPLFIWAKGIDNVLYIAFYGQNKPPKIEWHHETLKTIEAPKVYKNNAELSEGTEKVVLEGMNGAIMKSWITIENPDGSSTIKQMPSSSYQAMPYIIEKNK